MILLSTYHMEQHYGIQLWSRRHCWETHNVNALTKHREPEYSLLVAACVSAFRHGPRNIKVHVNKFLHELIPSEIVVYEQRRGTDLQWDTHSGSTKSVRSAITSSVPRLCQAVISIYVLQSVCEHISVQRWAQLTCRSAITFTPRA